MFKYALCKFIGTESAGESLLQEKPVIRPGTGVIIHHNAVETENHTGFQCPVNRRKRHFDLIQCLFPRFIAHNFIFRLFLQCAFERSSMHCKRRSLLKQTDRKKRIIRIKIIDIADKIHLRIDSELDAVSAPDSGERKLLKMFIVRDIGGKVKILSVMRQIKLRAQILRSVISRVVNGMNMVSAGDRNRFDLFPCIKGAVDADPADSRNPDQFRRGELAGIRLVISLEVDCHLNRFFREAAEARSQFPSVPWEA